MDQRETLPGTTVSTWSEGLLQVAKDRLILGGLILGGVLTLAWMALLAWQALKLVI
ncbi:hypothetical protein [Methylorubrum extorquens]